MNGLQRQLRVSLGVPAKPRLLLLSLLVSAALPLSTSIPASAQWLQAGSGAPTNSSGVESAWYIDTATGKFYGPYTSKAWPASSSNLTTWLAALSGAQTAAGTWTFSSAITASGGITNPLRVTEGLPAISSCGNTPPAATAGSSNNAGQFTLGTGTPTACTVTFANAYATAAFCTVSPASAGGAAITGGYYISAQSKTAFTLTIGTGTDSLVWNYTCVGN